MNYVREYWERISSGEIVTSKRVKAVYGRLVAEMDAADESSPYYFDEAVGERPIIFVERFCKQSQGTLGESLTLELFQKAFIQLLFGWLERATGYRRFRETLFLVGRKNGKSTLLAALALYMLVADYEGAAEIYSVATKKDQAKKTLTEAVNMVKQSPELSAILKKRRNDIYFPATASKFEALASDSNTLDGLNSHAVTIPSASRPAFAYNSEIETCALNGRIVGEEERKCPYQNRDAAKAQRSISTSPARFMYSHITASASCRKATPFIFPCRSITRRERLIA